MSRRLARPRGVVQFIESESLFTVRFHVPFPVALKDRVKAVHGSRWHTQRGCWLIPGERSAELLAALHGEAFELSDAARALLVAAAEIAGLDGHSIGEATASVSKASAPLSRIEQEAAAFRARVAEQETLPLGVEEAGVVPRVVAESAREQESALRVGTGPVLRRVVAPPTEAASPSYPSVRTLLQRAERALQQAFTRNEWVVGVAQSVTHSSRGHLYFRLMDAEDFSTQNGNSALDVAIFGAQAQRVLRSLQEHNLQLEEGMTIALCGELKVYGPKSSLQFVASAVDARVSRGEVELQRDRVVAAIQAKGLSHRNLRHALPLLPQRIALLTSGQGEALHDVLRTLAGGKVGAALRLFDVAVQGPLLEESVVRALQEIELRRTDFDLVLVVRGGGAANELAWWDNLAVCEAIAACSLPVVVGIGHDRDISALHEVARFEATPTAVAQVVVRAWHEARVWAEDRTDTIVREAQLRLRQAADYLEQRAQQFRGAAAGPLRNAEHQLTHNYPRRIDAGTQRALLLQQQELGRRQAMLAVEMTRALSEARRRQGTAEEFFTQANLRGRLTREEDMRQVLSNRLRGLVEGRLTVARRELALADGVVRASDPSRWLARGYAIVRNADGDVLRDTAALAAGDVVDVSLAQGRFRAAVEGVDTLSDLLPKTNKGSD